MCKNTSLLDFKSHDKAYFCVLQILCVLCGVHLVSTASLSTPDTCSEPSEDTLGTQYRQYLQTDVHQSFYQIPFLGDSLHVMDAETAGSLVYGDDQSCTSQSSGMLSERSVCPYHYVQTYQSDRYTESSNAIL